MDSDIFAFASIIGSLAFGLSGLLIGVRKELDIMGLFIVAMLTASGGGVLRDVLVGQTPSILVDITGFVLIIVIMVLFLAFNIQKFDGLERRLLFVVSDSVGLAAFSVTGALVGLNADLNFFGVLVLAFLTATGGGIIRDVFVNEVPAVLSSGFYGSVAILIGSMIYLLNLADLLGDATIALVFGVGLIVRLLAHYYNWHLPRVRKGAPYLDDIRGEGKGDDKS